MRYHSHNLLTAHLKCCIQFCGLCTGLCSHQHSLILEPFVLSRELLPINSPCRSQLPSRGAHWGGSLLGADLVAKPPCTWVPLWSGFLNSPQSVQGLHSSLPQCYLLYQPVTLTLSAHHLMDVGWALSTFQLMHRAFLCRYRCGPVFVCLRMGLEMECLAPVICVIGLQVFCSTNGLVLNKGLNSLLFYFCLKMCPEYLFVLLRFSVFYMTYCNFKNKLEF